MLISNKRLTRFLSLTTVFLVLTYSFFASALLMKVHATSSTAQSDTLTRLQISVASPHTIVFTMSSGVTLAANETVIYDFNEDASAFVVAGAASVANDFDFITVKTATPTQATIGNVVVGAPNCTGLVAANDVAVGIDDTNGIITVKACGSFTTTDATSALTLKYGSSAVNGGSGTDRVTNPASAGQYRIQISGTYGDTAEVDIPIIDDDTVNVTGYIQTFISFDIDTTTSSGSDCAYNTCLQYATGPTNTTSYTVDLGEMTTSSINASGTSVLHADGGTGAINKIYFDLSTNASSGAVVTQKSGNGFLQGPGGNTIPAVSNGSNIVAGTEAYGVQLVSGDTTVTSGTVTRNTSCDTATEFCAPSTTATSIFDSTSAPVDTARVGLVVAATPNALDATGTYTDTLTYVATATF